MFSLRRFFYLYFLLTLPWVTVVGKPGVTVVGKPRPQTAISTQKHRGPPAHTNIEETTKPQRFSSMRENPSHAQRPQTAIKREREETQTDSSDQTVEKSKTQNVSPKHKKRKKSSSPTHRTKTSPPHSPPPRTHPFKPTDMKKGMCLSSLCYEGNCCLRHAPEKKENIQYKAAYRQIIAPSTQKSTPPVASVGLLQEAVTMQQLPQSQSELCVLLPLELSTFDCLSGFSSLFFQKIAGDDEKREVLEDFKKNTMLLRANDSSHKLYAIFSAEELKGRARMEQLAKMVADKRWLSYNMVSMPENADPLEEHTIYVQTHGTKGVAYKMIQGHKVVEKTIDFSRFGVDVNLSDQESCLANVSFKKTVCEEASQHGHMPSLSTVTMEDLLWAVGANADTQQPSEKHKNYRMSFNKGAVGKTSPRVGYVVMVDTHFLQNKISTAMRLTFAVDLPEQNANEARVHHVITLSLAQYTPQFNLAIQREIQEADRELKRLRKTITDKKELLNVPTTNHKELLSQIRATEELLLRVEETIRESRKLVEEYEAAEASPRYSLKHSP